MANLPFIAREPLWFHRQQLGSSFDSRLRSRSTRGRQTDLRWQLGFAVRFGNVAQVFVLASRHLWFASDAASLRWLSTGRDHALSGRIARWPFNWWPRGLHSNQHHGHLSFARMFAAILRRTLWTATIEVSFSSYLDGWSLRFVGSQRCSL